MEKNYWENRYKNNGNSGLGSYGKYYDFKSKIINEFLNNNEIKSIFDYGCGDGNQLLGLELKERSYVGSDISNFIIEKLNKKYTNNPKINFISNDKIINDIKYDLVMSLDVIYHIVDDEMYKLYIKNLKNLTGKYLIIYSSDEISASSPDHIKHRIFMNDVIDDGSFSLITKIKNEENTSADFYFFEKK